MKTKILFLSIFTVLFGACNNDSDTLMPEDMKVQVAINTSLESHIEDFTKTTDYDRPDSTPVEISGVTITVQNTELEKDKYPTGSTYPDVVKTFPFESTDDSNEEPITMEIGVGSSYFSAVSTCSNSAGTTIIQDLLTRQTTGTNKEKAAVYNPDIQTAQAIYVQYATEFDRWRNVQFNTVWYNLLLIGDPDDADDDLTHDEIFASVDDNDPTTPIVKMANAWPGFVNLSLTSQLGRVQIVFESEVDGPQFKVTPVLYAADGTTQLSAPGTLDHTGTTSASAMIFNGTDMEDGTYIKVQVDKTEDGSTWETLTDAISIPTIVGANHTHVILYTGNEVTDAGFSLTYSPEFTDVNGGTELTE